MGCHAPLQGIFLTQRLNPGVLCIPHWQKDALPPGKAHLYVNSYNKLTFKSKSFVNEILFEGYIFVQVIFLCFLTTAMLTSLSLSFFFFFLVEGFQKCIWFLGFSGGSMVKNLPAIQETQEMWVQFLGWENPLEEGTTTHHSSLVCRSPRTEEPGSDSLLGRRELNTTKWISTRAHVWTLLYECSSPVHWKVCVFLPWRSRGDSV